jgi:hypothetical protein
MRTNRNLVFALACLGAATVAGHGRAGTAVNPAEYWDSTQFASIEPGQEGLVLLKLGSSQIASTVAKLGMIVCKDTMNSDSVDRIEEVPVLARIYARLVRLQVVADKYGDFSVNTLLEALQVYEQYTQSKTITSAMLNRDSSRINAIKLIRLMVEIKARITPLRSEDIELLIKSSEPTQEDVSE